MKKVLLEAMSFDTKLPAPIITLEPILIPGIIIEHAPITVFFSIIGLLRCCLEFALFGYLELVKVTFGPKKTFLPI